MRENSPKKWLFLEFCFAPALARPKERKYFAQSRFPKYRCFFDVRGQKTAKIRSPPRWVRRHDQNMYPRKGIMSSGELPKKVRFFAIFRNWNCVNVNFPFFEIKIAQTWISQAIRNLEEIIHYYIFFYIKLVFFIIIILYLFLFF